MLALGAWPTPAHAQRPTAEQMQTFKDLVKEGSHLREDGKLWKALAEFQKARKILDHPKLAFNIGKLREQTGACDKARELYRNVLARPHLEDALRVAVVDQLQKSDQCKPHATLRIACVPADARVHIGSHELTCPVNAKIKPAKFKLLVTALGYHKQSIDVDLAPGDLFDKHVRLRKETSAAAQAKAQPKPTPGATHSSGKGLSNDLALHRVEPAKPTPWKRYAAYGAMGVGGALLVGGVVSDYSAQSRAQEFVAANNAGDRKRAAQLKSDADSAQVRTIVLYSAGAVLAAGGVALWVYDSHSEPDAASVHASIGLGAGGPTVQGSLNW